MSVHVRQLAAAQADVVAAWQLRRLGWSERKVQRWVRSNGWRAIHSGVYVAAHSPPTRRQLWVAATLTAPGSALSHGSGGACYGFYAFQPGYETITRRGTGRRTRHPRLLVHHSLLLDDEVANWNGVRVTTAERTMIDIAAGGIGERSVARMFREALRLRTTTIRRLQLALDRYRGRRGTRVLRDLAARYASIPYERTRSDAEARGLELLHDVGAEPPLVNFRVGGEEADLVYLKSRTIIEIDGPQYHRFVDEDERKRAVWERAGFTVTRIPSGEIYGRPELLAEIATRRTARPACGT